MSSKSLGQEITQAYNFLREVHQDTHTLITTLDQLMDERGWYPTESARVSDDLGNRLNSNWLLNSVYRFYFPLPEGGQERQATEILGIQIEFSGEKAFDEPICLAVAAKFDKRISTKFLWDAWTHEGSITVLRHLSSASGTQVLSDKLRADFLATAVTASAFVIPLCSLDGRDAVDTMIAAPLLKLSRSL